MEDEADLNASLDSFVPDGQQENSQWLPRPWTIVKVRNLRLDFKSKQIKLGFRSHRCQQIKIFSWITMCCLIPIW